MSRRRKPELRSPLWLKIAVGLQALAILFLIGNSTELRLKPVDMTYYEWVTILLVAVTVIVSILAVLLAVLAFVGWGTFDKRVGQTVNEYLTDGFGVNGNLRPQLEEAVERVSYDIPGIPEESEDDSGDDTDV